MRLLVVFVVSLVPGLLWVWYFYRQDRYDKEPPLLILWTFLAGMAAVIPAAIVEAPFRGLLIDPPNLFVRFVASVAVVGLAEEGFKLLSAYWAAFGRRAFDEPVDGIIYAVTASLGFASLENVFYTLAYGFEVAPVRAVVTTLAHASFGGVAGYYLGLSLHRPQERLALATKGILIAAAIHGVYDFLIIAQLAHPIVAIVIIYATYRFVARRIRHLAERPSGPI